jgi:hypothetical protein
MLTKSSHQQNPTWITVHRSVNPTLLYSTKQTMMDAKSLLCDALAAAGTALCVAPAIAILDQAIVENAAGSKTLTRSLKDSVTQLVRKPLHFAKSPAFLLLWGVYGGTYLAVNVATTACDRTHATAEQRHAVKFVGVSSVNVALNVSKDRIFAKLFGAGVPRPVPVRTIAAFAARDSMTVFASFNVAPVVAEALAGAEIAGARTVAQLVCPVVMQWFSAPLHLIGLNWYNVSTATNSERASFLRQEYFKTALARSCRILPAFGIAPLINTPLRATAHEWFCNHNHAILQACQQ